MFCLRSWIPMLFFLTNASPIYLVLFISATYFLNRPCVYCSVILAVLVLSLFDFRTNWFEPRYSSSNLPHTVSNDTIASNTTLETASLVASAINQSASAIASAALESVKRRVTGSGAHIQAPAGDWTRSLGIRKEWRVSCMDIILRL
ncbi:hypothetical protein M501DRAFT_1002729 [Patellaria atrata CBS 101060]|uniref:Uncharacterized protein n=1 Tax=Patellaria atrata CBS 101060 TaxID=1346257 RepID=A0A9P4SEM8_9PEZI|nr:hypothetical protein M501DRAFT_1002729 [Patellaria atrata CBS 101060]